MAPVYRDACLNPDIEMKHLAELLEYLAHRLEKDNPHTIWQRIDVNRELYDRPAYRNYLVNLKRTYFIDLVGAMEAKIHALTADDPEQGFIKWEHLYFEALAHWNSIAYFSLCSRAFDFDEKKQNQISRFQKISYDVFDSRWDLVYPFYCELAENEQLPDELRSRFAVYAGQIQLYHQLPDNDLALEHFQQAENISPGVHTQQAFGEYHLKISESKKARTYFMEALTMDPDNIDSYLFVGDSYRDEEEYDTAAQWYNDALHMNFMEPAVYKRLLLLYAQPEYGDTKKEDMHRLINYAEEIAFNHPYVDDLNDLYRAAANAFYEMNDLEEAEKYYRAAVNNFPDLTQAYIDLGYILTFAEKFEEAVEVYEKAAGLSDPLFDVYWGWAYTWEKMNNYKKVAECYEHCLELMPSRAETITYYLAYAYEQTEEYEAAKKIYKELIRNHPGKEKYISGLQGILEKSGNINELEQLLKDQTENEPESAERHNVLGNFYFDHDQFEQAILHYEAAIELNDREPVYRENLGLALQETGRFDEAEKAYKQAIALDPDSGKYFNRLGVFYNDVGDHSKAVPYYQKALEREPGTILYLSNLGIGYTWLQQVDQAEQTFKEVLQRDPDHKVAHAELSELFLKAERYEEARPHLEKLVELEPGILNYIGNLGYVYQQLGDYERALAFYEQALALQPHSDYYHNQAGVVHYWQGNLQQAKVHYHHAIENNPNMQIYYSNLGLVLNDLNEMEASKEAYATAAELARQQEETFKR